MKSVKDILKRVTPIQRHLELAEDLLYRIVRNYKADLKEGNPYQLLLIDDYRDLTQGKFKEHHYVDGVHSGHPDIHYPLYLLEILEAARFIKTEEKRVDDEDIRLIVTPTELALKNYNQKKKANSSDAIGVLS